MKTSLTHLPKKKREELEQIVSIIRDRCQDVEIIILFGSYARGDWKEESNLEPNRKSGHKSDYDILVVTKEKHTAHNANIWHEITKVCSSLKQSTHARIISHDIDHLNIQLAEGQYFFSDIKKEGRALYDAGNHELANERKLTPEEQKRIALDYFEHWFERAQRFFHFFESAISQGWDKDAAFQLHQAAETSYKTILFVFTGYNPNEHYLDLLNEMVADEDASFRDIFPQTTEDERKRFRLLDYAYIRARYDPEFQIAQEELELLAIHVKSLLKLTEKSCKAKIGNFTKEN